MPATSSSPKPVAHLHAGALLVPHVWGRGIGRKSCNLSAHVNPGAVESGHHRLWERQDGGQEQWVQTPRPKGSSGGCSPQCWLISCLTKPRISSSCRAHEGPKVVMGDGAIKEGEKPFPQGLAEPRGEGSPYISGSGMHPAPLPTPVTRVPRAYAGALLAPYRHAWLPLLPTEPVGARTALGTAERRWEAGLDWSSSRQG